MRAAACGKVHRRQCRTAARALPDCQVRKRADVIFDVLRMFCPRRTWTYCTAFLRRSCWKLDWHSGCELWTLGSDGADLQGPLAVITFWHRKTLEKRRLDSCSTAVMTTIRLICISRFVPVQVPTLSSAIVLPPCCGLACHAIRDTISLQDLVSGSTISTSFVRGFPIMTKLSSVRAACTSHPEALIIACSSSLHGVLLTRSPHCSDIRQGNWHQQHNNGGPAAQTHWLRNTATTNRAAASCAAVDEAALPVLPICFRRAWHCRQAAAARGRWSVRSVGRPRPASIGLPGE